PAARCAMCRNADAVEKVTDPLTACGLANARAVQSPCAVSPTPNVDAMIIPPARNANAGLPSCDASRNTIPATRIWATRYLGSRLRRSALQSSTVTACCAWFAARSACAIQRLPTNNATHTRAATHGSKGRSLSSSSLTYVPNAQAPDVQADGIDTHGCSKDVQSCEKRA